MATDRQIAANRLNASKSTGPKTEEGKANSRVNATRHGMAGASGLVDEGLSAAFEDRRDKWGREYRPAGELANWALDRAVAASLRIEQCERAVEEVVEVARKRAGLAWDQDRGVEAALIAGRLSKDPVLASRQLQTSRAGAALMLEAWVGLVAKLEKGEDWSESEASRALDLFGVASDLRAGRTLIDPEPGDDPLSHRRSLAFEEIERLEALIEESLMPLDALDRRIATGGNSALLSKAAKLVLRYERDAWRRYRESIRQVEGSAGSVGLEVSENPAGEDELPSPVVERQPEVLEPDSDSFEKSQRTLLEVAMPIGAGLIAGFEAIGIDDDSAWIEELERRGGKSHAGFTRTAPLAAQPA